MAEYRRSNSGLEEEDSTSSDEETGDNQKRASGGHGLSSPDLSRSDYSFTEDSQGTDEAMQQNEDDEETGRDPQTSSPQGCDDLHTTESTLASHTDQPQPSSATLETPAETASLKTRDIAKWLEIKLGSQDELWNSRAASSILNKETLESLDECFQELQPQVKLKLLLGIFHLSKRNLEQWREQIENLLSLAAQDTDDWVSTVGDLLKDFCVSGGFAFSSDDSSHFNRTLSELRKCVRKHAKGEGGIHLVPLDASYYSKNVAKSLTDTNMHSKLFNPKRRPKSATVKADLLQKSHDVANQVKTKGGSLSSIVPIRARNMARKMDDTSPYRGIPTPNALKTSGGFSRTTKTFGKSNLSLKRAGGVKLIEIDETPQALKKKQKETEQEEREQRKREREELKVKMAEEKEAKKREQLAAAQARAKEKMQQASKVVPKVKERQRPAEDMVEDDNEDVEMEMETEIEDRSMVSKPPAPTPQYAAGLVEATQPPPILQPSVSRPSPSLPSASPSGRDAKQTTNAPNFSTVPGMKVTSNFPGIVVGSRGGPSTGVQRQQSPGGTLVLQRPFGQRVITPNPIIRTPTANTGSGSVFRTTPGQQVFTRVPVPAPTQGFYTSALHPPPVASPPPTAPQQPTPHKQYTLTKEVMAQAQDMFRTANKLSRPEKALILGFMAGSRENPMPTMGNILTVRLSETTEMEANPDNPALPPTPMKVETFFQMNYNNGEWKRLKKIRPVDL